jgi:Outer membrane protein beta-barrel domain
LEKEMKKYILLALAVLPAVASAQEVQGNGLTYNYVGAGYGRLNYSSDGVKATLTGFGIEAGALVAENIFLEGGYSSVSANKFSVNGTSYNIGLDLNQTAVAVGYRLPLSKGTDLTGSVGITRGTAKATGVSSVSDTIYPLSVGIRSAINEAIQLGASGTVADGNFSAGAYLQYKLGSNVGLVGSYSGSNYGNGYTLSVRYLF